MRLIARLLGFCMMVLALVGVGLCGTGVVQVWQIRSQALEKVSAIKNVIDNGLTRAAEASTTIDGSSIEIRTDLQIIISQPGIFEPGSNLNESTAAYLRRVTKRLRNFSEVLSLSSEAMTSANQVPLINVDSLNPGFVERLQEKAAMLPPELNAIKKRLGEKDKQVSDEDIIESAMVLDQVVRKCQTIADQVKSELEEMKEKLPEMEAKIHNGLSIACWAITVVLVWIGLGQLSLLIHGWKWCFFRSE